MSTEIDPWIELKAVGLSSDAISVLVKLNETEFITATTTKQHLQHLGNDKINLLGILKYNTNNNQWIEWIS